MIGDFSGSKIIDYIGSNFTTFSLRFPLNPENNAFRAHIRVERTKYQRRNGKLVVILGATNRLTERNTILSRFTQN